MSHSLNTFPVSLSFIENVAEANVYKVIVDLFLAGGETTGTSLDWSLLYMITYPEIQSKCQDEIDHVCCKHKKKSYNYLLVDKGV